MLRTIARLSGSVITLIMLPVTGLCAQVPLPEVPADAGTRLTLSVRDIDGAWLDARVQVLDPAGKPLWPRGPDVRRYDAYSGHHYFYVSGPVTLGSRRGPVRVLVSRGPEYATYDAWIPLGQSAVTVTLNRLFDIGSFGWYGGDTHVHPAHGGEGAVYTITPADLEAMARAEDLAVVCALSNGPNFAGSGAAAAGPGHWIHYGMEYRSALFGHLALLGLQSLLPTGCCLSGEAAYPLNIDIATQAHAQQATVVAAHPVTMDPALMGLDLGEWPYSGFNRELPADVLLGGVDALDVLSYSNVGGNKALSLWFDLLNLGFRPVLSAGTDASVNRWFDPPMGGYRVYARLPAGTALTFGSWLEAYRGGETFVTNGPLPFSVVLEGKRPGQTVYLMTNTFTQLTGRVVAYTKEKLEFLDVYYNGALRNRFYLPLHYETLDYPFALSLPPTDGWVVLRLSGPSSDPTRVGSEQFAITSPIFIQGEPRPADEALQAEYDGWIASLQDLVSARPAGNPDNRQSVMSRLQSARAILSGTPVGPDSTLPSSVATTLGFRLESRPGLLLAGGTGAGSVQWFDVRGRLLQGAEPQPLPAAFPVPHLLPSGVYFARLVDDTGATRATLRVVKTD